MALKAKEIAEIIGVSQATLSLVINNKPGISDKTRQKVIAELKERGYEYLLGEEVKSVTPSGNSDNSKTIGFVTYQVGGELLGYNSFFPLIISGIEMEASKEFYHITYINIDRNHVSDGIRQLQSSGCCGYVLFATELKKEDMEHFLKLGIPFVVLDNYFLDYHLDTVKVNNQQGTYLAVKYLYERGHRKIGYLKSTQDINSFNERFQKALEAMNAFGCITPEKYVFEIGYPSDKACEGMLKKLDGGSELPTAFIGDNDLVIAGAMKAMQLRGYTLPEDCSFIGFDDRPVCEWLTPQLTTVRLPREYFGGEAVRLLIQSLETADERKLKVEINTTLIERDSVTVPRQ